MTVVKYPRHRQYEAQRVDANNAVMALLAGSKLAASVLHLTDGSTHRLAELFPKVQHVERLNLKTSEARRILSDAENHVGAMAIPYVLSIHEDYVVSLCGLLKNAGAIAGSQLESIGPANMHERFEAACRGQFTPSTLRLFHFLRLVRNAQIHYAGRAHSALVTHLADGTRGDVADWEGITGSPMPAYALGDELRLTVFELIGTLAISKRLAEEANELLQVGLPRNAWLDMIVDDWAMEPRRGNTQEMIRNAYGFARFQYGPLAVTRGEIENLLRDRGHL